MRRFLILGFILISILNSYGQTAEEFAELAKKKMEIKDYQYAMIYIDKAISLDNKNQWYYLSKAEIEANLYGPREALKIINAALLIDKKNAEVYNRAGTYYESGGMADSAILMYNTAIKYGKNDTAKFSYTMNRAVAYASKRNFKEAVKDLEAVLMFDPKNIGALNNIAPAYRELGMIKESIASLKQLIVIDPAFIGSYVNLGFIYSKIDSNDLALKYFNKAVEIAPKEPLVYNNRGFVYYKLGDLTKALKDINLSIEMYPSNSYAYKNLGLVYIAMDKFNEACAALKFANDYGFQKRYGPEVSELIVKYCNK